MEILKFGDPGASAVLIQPVDSHDLEEMDSEIELISSESPIKFRLVAVRVSDWNRDLSPWEAPPVFGKNEFGGKAENTLGDILSLCTEKEKNYIIGGYSLAALFSLWSAYQTDVFSGVAAASPSVWYPGFTVFMRNHHIKTRVVCLSLGDKEDKSGNPVLASVGNKIREAHGLLQNAGVDCVLEWNEGNHFRDSGKRTARAFLSVMRRLK